MMNTPFKIFIVVLANIATVDCTVVADYIVDSGLVVAGCTVEIGRTVAVAADCIVALGRIAVVAGHK